MQNDQTTGDLVFRSHLARRVTTGALIFVGVVASITLTSAGIYALIGPTPEKSAFFFDVAKYIMATILPVVAGWVGTVLAFYFGKENFEAATRSVTSAARALTSKEKLAATVTGSLGKKRSEFKALSLTADESKDPASVKLDRIEAGFTEEKKKDKPYERLPVLLANDVPYMVLHRSTLNSFLVDKKREPDGKDKDAKDYTLKDLFQKVEYLPKDSFVTVGPDATAAQAKTDMEKIGNCSDVFVTADGTRQGAVTRWITNVDLLEAAEV
jgi:hypothetical protein